MNIALPSVQPDLETASDNRPELASRDRRRSGHQIPEPKIAVDAPVRPRDHYTRRALAVADALALAAAFAAVGVVGDGFGFESYALSLLTIPVWIALFKLYGLYDRDAKRISHSTIDDLPHLVHALLVGSLGFWAYSKLALPERLELAQGFVFFLSALAFIPLARAVVRTQIAPRLVRDRVIFVGDNQMAEVLLRKLRLHPEYGLDPVGYLAPQASAHEIPGHPRLGDPIQDLKDSCERLSVNRVVILASGLEQDVLVDVVRRCSELNLKVGIVPDLVEVLGSALENDHLEGIAVLGLSPPVFSRSSRLIKRAMDVSVALLAIILAAPVMLVAAVAILISSGRPILFSQERIGRGGRSFRIHKFRTMVPDAEAREAEMLAQSSHPAWVLVEKDPRITRVGRSLRRTSIDELPQLFNVLAGDMSLVGPRPMPPSVDSQISGWGRRRLDLTPGITGLWQALGRTSIPFEEMVKLDYLYVTNWSLWEDVRLLMRTLPTIVSRRGVN